MTMPTKFFVFLKCKPERKNAIFFKYHSGKSGMPTKIGHKLIPIRGDYARQKLQQFGLPLWLEWW
jgi:hypothetical protein